MPIDKSNSKPWVKVTVWVLTFCLIFAFMGTGVWFLIANGRYLFSGETAADQQQQEPTDEQYIAAFEQQIADLEAQLAKEESAETKSTLAGYSAYYASWLFNRGDRADFEHAIQLLERAIELDPETQGENAQSLIDQIRSAMTN